jgi:SAM-dependent methyltransferase
MSYAGHNGNGWPQRLNLGCGPDAPPNWLNVDGSWNAWLSSHRYLRRGLEALRVVDPNVGAKWNVKPVVHDITRPLPFDSDSFSAVYSSHVLEHLYLEDARSLLKECHRVLRRGGVIRIVVPDLQAMVSVYIRNKSEALTTGSKQLAADALNEKLGFRGPRPPAGNALFRLYSLWKDFHHHRWMYDSDSLIQYVREAGFEEVSRREFLDSAIPGLEEVEKSDRVSDGIGICIEGRKRSEDEGSTVLEQEMGYAGH